MARINENYLKLKAGYLFPEIGRRVAAFQKANPEAKVIKLGIGDVTRPLVPAVVEAMHAAVDEMGSDDGFHGYGPEQGYEFLRDLIREHDYAARGVEVGADEIFVSDGSKCDSGNIQEIFGDRQRRRAHRPGLSRLRRHQRDGRPHRRRGRRRPLRGHRLPADDGRERLHARAAAASTST